MRLVQMEKGSCIRVTKFAKFKTYLGQGPCKRRGRVIFMKEMLQVSFGGLGWAERLLYV